MCWICILSVYNIVLNINLIANAYLFQLHIFMAHVTSAVDKETTRSLQKLVAENTNSHQTIAVVCWYVYFIAYKFIWFMYMALANGCYARFNSVFIGAFVWIYPDHTPSYLNSCFVRELQIKTNIFLTLGSPLLGGPTWLSNWETTW